MGRALNVRNKTGVTGVIKTDDGRFQAHVYNNRKWTYLGRYDTCKEAAAVVELGKKNIKKARKNIRKYISVTYEGKDYLLRDFAKEIGYTYSQVYHQYYNKRQETGELILEGLLSYKTKGE